MYYVSCMKYDVVLIKKMRVMKGLSQTELARRIGKTSSMVSLIESGKVDGMPGTIKAIADELGLKMRDLVIDENATWPS